MKGLCFGWQLQTWLKIVLRRTLSFLAQVLLRGDFLMYNKITLLNRLGSYIFGGCQWFKKKVSFKHKLYRRQTCSSRGCHLIPFRFSFRYMLVPSTWILWALFRNPWAYFCEYRLCLWLGSKWVCKLKSFSNSEVIKEVKIVIMPQASPWISLNMQKIFPWWYYLCWCKRRPRKGSFLNIFTLSFWWIIQDAKWHFMSFGISF